MGGDIGDAVTWLVHGVCVRRACWDSGSYIYKDGNDIRCVGPGATEGSKILATGEDLLADDWEPVGDSVAVPLPTTTRVEDRRPDRVVDARMVGKKLGYADDEPPEGSVVRDNNDFTWHNTGTPMGNGEMQPGGAHWQRDYGDDEWSDPESWAYVCQWAPVTVIEWGYQ